MQKRRSTGIERLKRKYAYLFLAPFIFGIVVFVIVPLGQCLLYSVSDVKMTPEGLKMSFVGAKYYRYLFVEDAHYLDLVASSLSSLFSSIPIVVALSMALALILNQKFRGRLLARAVFFLPVIIASGAVMRILSSFGMQDNMVNSGDSAAEQQAAQYMNVIDFSALLERLELPDQISSLMQTYLSNTFNLIWSCGIPILLFVAGLQTIPTQLYEVGRVEGITAWEEFWYITVPMMGRIILLVIFYTMVDLFITNSPLVNDVITVIGRQDYSKSSAMIWPYFLIVGFVIGLVVIIYNRLCLKKWE